MTVPLLEILAVLTQVPLLADVFRQAPRRDLSFWLRLAAAVGAPLAVAISQNADAWHPGFGPTLWVTVAGTAVIYGLIAVLVGDAWRLAPLQAGYLAILGGIAILLGRVSGSGGVVEQTTGPWITVHITTAIATYALITVAAISATAAAVRETALKNKRPTRLSRHLPSIAGCETLLIRLLAIGEGILAIGLATGMAIEYHETRHLLLFNHKTVLTLAAFIVIGVLLAAHYGTGMRGRQAVRFVLLGYLLLTLGYPGVKFVTDVLMA